MPPEISSPPNTRPILIRTGQAVRLEGTGAASPLWEYALAGGRFEPIANTPSVDWSVPAAASRPSAREQRIVVRFSDAGADPVTRELVLVPSGAPVRAPAPGSAARAPLPEPFESYLHERSPDRAIRRAGGGLPHEFSRYLHGTLRSANK